ncbi:hypothetical protein K7432_006762 [Basidiobolus ranarum]|uniref:Uncharacterized protein n=1 Tax=Basidiobolus ranarum TaxID=34480 RepID=A0ABR2W138_9FUNG
MVYLPHDSFYQQKIGLENAILLAYYLNRSLIVPPAYLGNLIEWAQFDTLYSQVARKSKQSKSYCSDIALRELPGECLSYTSWTKIPWSYFFDLSGVEDYVRIYEETDFTFESLSRYGIEEEDIHIFKEDVKYEHKFSDATVLRDDIKGHFKSLLHFNKLKEFSHKLLYLHSVNGRGRVQASHPDNYPVFRDMLRSYVWKSTAILSTADLVIDKLGGQQNYVGIEVPTLGLEFSDKIPVNVRTILNMLMDRISDRECEQPASNPKSGVPSLEECLARTAQDSCSSPLLYLSTDAINPRAHGDLTPIFQQFPCTFTPHDFRQEYSSLGTQLNAEAHVNLVQYMISMVETEIISRGSSVATIKNSMQGVYAGLLHDIYFHKKSKIYTKIDFSG